MWLGSTPLVYYTEMRVHPQNSLTERPGWLRCEQFGAGMITGWGQHHFDSAAWGMDTELTGPVLIEAVAQFPKSGLWDVHGDFMAKAEYKNGITMLTSGGYPNGVRYEGTEGWIFVTSGSYTASPSDPVLRTSNSKALDASDPAILSSVIGRTKSICMSVMNSMATGSIALNRAGNLYLLLKQATGPVQSAFLPISP